MLCWFTGDDLPFGLVPNGLFQSLMQYFKSTFRWERMACSAAFFVRIPRPRPCLSAAAGNAKSFNFQQDQHGWQPRRVAFRKKVLVTAERQKVTPNKRPVKLRVGLVQIETAFRRSQSRCKPLGPKHRRGWQIIFPPSVQASIKCPTMSRIIRRA